MSVGYTELITSRELRSPIQRLGPKIFKNHPRKKKSKLPPQKGLTTAPFHQ